MKAARCVKMSGLVHGAMKIDRIDQFNTLEKADLGNLKYVWSTSDDQHFDGPTAVARHVGVSVEDVCKTATEALQENKSSFECNGFMVKRQQIVHECPSDPSTDAGVEYLLTMVPYQQVCAQMQATAMRLFPDRCLRLPVRSLHQAQTIRSWTSRDLQHSKFDLAQVWSVYSPSTFTTAYSFRRALLGEPHEKPVAELNKETYPSLTFFRIDPKTNTALSNGKLVVAMSAQDIISFMLSEFARKGPYNEIFEIGPRNGLAYKQVFEDSAPSTPPLPQARPPPLPPPLPPPPTYAAAVALASPRRVFEAACARRMRELELSLRASGDVAATGVGAERAAERAAKRRRMALEAAVGMTGTLFDAHRLVLAEMMRAE